jgi:ATP-dependent DNA helicase PIF1
LVSRVTVKVAATQQTVHVTRTTYDNRIVGEVPYARYEFPLILAYAMTAHRCQGATMRLRVIIRCRDAFAAGMLYVMLSRVPNRQDLYIVGGFTPADFLPAQLSAEDVTREGLRQAAKARKGGRR